MGRPGAAKRLKKAEKAKVQLKGYATKFLPKGKNITDTTFKVRKIVLHNQIKNPDKNEALTRRKLSIKEVLSRLQHYSSAQRLEGLSGVCELLHQMDKKQLTANLLSILDNLGKLSLDVESRVRRSAARALTALLSEVDETHLSPFSTIIGSYVSCAMTHIRPSVQEDSLLVLDALLQHAPSLIVHSASQLLSCSLDMISRLRDEKGTNRQLSVNLSSSLTSSTWRASVLGRLQALLNVSMRQLLKEDPGAEEAQNVLLTADALKGTHFPLYKSQYTMSACLSQVFHLNNLSKSHHHPLKNFAQLKNYTESLIPLLLDSWVEVSPSKSTKHVWTEIGLSVEAALILHCVLEIKYLLLEHLILYDRKNGCSDLTNWFTRTYSSDLQQYFTVGFPFTAQTDLDSDSEEVTDIKQRQVLKQNIASDVLAHIQKASSHGPQFQRDSTTCDAVVKCLPQNLRLCYISAFMLKSPPFSLKEKIINFLSTCLNDWDASWAIWNDHLLLALETVLECSCVWSCNMNELISAIISRCKRSAFKKSETHRLFSQSLCKLLGKITLSPSFPSLQKNESLHSWLVELPSFLTNSTLSVDTLRMFNKVARQNNEHFLKGLQDSVPHLLDLIQNLLLKPHNDTNAELGVGLVSLLYYVPEWTEEHVKLLGDIILKNISLPLTRKLLSILSSRRSSCSVLGSATWWNELSTS